MNQKTPIKPRMVFLAVFVQITKHGKLCVPFSLIFCPCYLLCFFKLCSLIKQPNRHFWSRLEENLTHVSVFQDHPDLTRCLPLMLTSPLSTQSLNCGGASCLCYWPFWPYDILIWSKLWVRMIVPMYEMNQHLGTLVNLLDRATTRTRFLLPKISLHLEPRSNGSN